MSGEKLVLIMCVSDLTLALFQSIDSHSLDGAGGGEGASSGMGVVGDREVGGG